MKRIVVYKVCGHCAYHIDRECTINIRKRFHRNIADGACNQFREKQGITNTNLVLIGVKK